MNEMPPLKLGWLVGILEGEGSFSVVRTTGRLGRLSVTVEMIDEDTIQRLRAVTGVGTLNSRQRGDEKSRGRQKLFSWTVSRREDVLALSRLVYPWLSARRQRQVDKMFDWVEENQHRFNAPPKRAS